MSIPAKHIRFTATSRYQQPLSKVQLVPRTERGLRNILRSHFQLMISKSQIDLGENSCTAQLIEEIVNSGQRISILDRHLIEFSVVYAQMHTTILFLDEENRCSPRGYTWSYKTLVLQFIDLLLQFSQLSRCHTISLFSYQSRTWHKVDSELNFLVWG